jgi:DNA (cytosine-5)-methyltransferase 1
MRDWRRYNTFLSGLAEMGYNVREQILDAKDFGVPQKRRRLFILCDRDATPSRVRPRANGEAKLVRDILDRNGKWKSRPLFADNRAANTVVRYLTGLERVGESKPFLLVYYGTDAGGGWQRLDRPLRTVTTVDRFALVQNERGTPRMRMLQVPELKRAMGFKASYQLNGGSRRDRIKLLGNAVCPPVMTAVVRALTRNSKQETEKHRRPSSRG